MIYIFSSSFRVFQVRKLIIHFQKAPLYCVIIVAKWSATSHTLVFLQ